MFKFLFVCFVDSLVISHLAPQFHSSPSPSTSTPHKGKLKNTY